MSCIIKRKCAWPGCGLLAIDGQRYCDEHLADGLRHDQSRKARKDTRSHWAPRANDELYHTQQWQTLRQHVLAEQGACLMCGGTDRLQVHHIEPPRGDPVLFFDRGNLCVLCKNCHDRVTNREIWSRLR